MASLLVTPDIVEFVDKLAVDAENAAHLEEILVDNLPKEFLLKSIRDLDVRRKTGCTVIGFKTPDNEYVINPEADTQLMTNSKLIVLGSLEQIRNLNKLF
ncbi:MAG: TrkA C-terminal domain-containing protein [Flavobacteriaceae bacterium]